MDGFIQKHFVKLIGFLLLLLTVTLLMNRMYINYFALCVAHSAIYRQNCSCDWKAWWDKGELDKSEIRLKTSLYFETERYTLLVGIFQACQSFRCDSLVDSRVLAAEYLITPENIEWNAWKNRVTSQQLYDLARSWRARGHKAVAEAGIKLAHYLDNDWRNSLDRALAFFQAGRIYQTEQKWTIAIEAYNQAIHSFQLLDTQVRYEYSSYVYRRLGEIATQQGDWAGAIEYYGQAILASLQHADFSVLVDILLKQKRSLQDAYTFLADLRQQDRQGDPYLWSNSALVFIQRGAPQMAEQVLAEVPMELENAFSIRYARARLAAAQGQWSIAEALYAALLDEEKRDKPGPQSVAPLTNALGEAILQQGRYTEAVTKFAEAVQLTPEVPKYWYNLGVAYQRLGKSDEARAALEKALALKPDYAAAQKALHELER